VSDIRAPYRAFMEEHVYPNEAALGREDDAAAELVADLRHRTSRPMPAARARASSTTRT
jgi:hypothetical protein